MTSSELKSSYKPFLHHINKRRSLRHAVIHVRVTRRLPQVFSAQQVQTLLNACARRRDRLLLSLLHESDSLCLFCFRGTVAGRLRCGGANPTRKVRFQLLYGATGTPDSARRLHVNGVRNH